MAEDDDAPGWSAIDAVFAQLYPGQAPQHWGTVMAQRVQFGGPEALDGVSAYAAEQPEPHWHWVTYGLTELYAKAGDDPARSGAGYELTMRSPRGADETPPLWPLNVLQQLANYAQRTGRVLEPGQTFDTRGKVGPEPCTLTALAFHADPQLPPIDTPNGSVEFVEVVALHPDELPFVGERGLDELLRTCAYGGELNVLDRGSSVA